MLSPFLNEVVVDQHTHSLLILTAGRNFDVLDEAMARIDAGS
jgi:hypothetical protein